jgi:LacI family transcriptional regulator
MSQTYRIALLMGKDLGYCRGLLRGIHSYAAQRDRPWVFHDAPPHVDVLGPLKEWKPRGILAHVFDRQLARKLMSMRKPLVNTTSMLMSLDIPFVDVDHIQAGRLAAKHFLDREFTHFGYFGSASTNVSKERERGFRDALAEVGHSLSSCYSEYLPRPPLKTSWKKSDQRIQAWLAGLPKPVAIFASNDVPARNLATMARMLGFRIPDDIALLGVDNDEMECLLSSPPLSSVANPAEHIGYEAAGLLDRLMAGERPLKSPLWIPPQHVVTRQSTDIVAVADSEVSTALVFIRQNVARAIGVADVVDAVSAGRRDLERRFRKALGRTPLQQIHRERIETAKKYLATTNLLMPSVARRSGYATPQRFAAVFRHATGMSPQAYRRKSRREW